MTPEAFPLVQSARAHALRGRYARALDELGMALRVAPESAQVWLEIGHVLAKKGAHAEGLEAFDQAIDLEARFAEAHFQRGLMLGELGRLEEARASLKRSAELSPEFSAAVEAEMARATLSNL